MRRVDDVKHAGSTGRPAFGVPALLVAVALLCLPARAPAAEWSERELDKTLVKIDRHMDRGDWDRVITQGRQALPQCIRLLAENSPRCVILLNKINHSLYHTGHLRDNRANIKKAYSLSSSVLGKYHFRTNLSRELYYRLLLAEENYLPAIDVVRDIIDGEKARNNDRFEILNRTRQLYALYGLTGQFAEEEATLRHLLAMTARLIGKDSQDYREAAQALAENLCSRKMYFEYFKFVNEQPRDISFDCRLRQ